MIPQSIQFFNCQKIIDHCIELAESHGFNGDPSKQVNRVGTLLQERAIIELLGKMPADMLRFNATMIRQVVRNIVLSHSIIDVDIPLDEEDEKGVGKIPQVKDKTRGTRRDQLTKELSE